MADKKIKQGVRLGARLFRTDNARDADELDQLLTKEDAQRLKKMGVLEGDFKGQGKEELEENDEPTPAFRPEGAKREVTKKGEVEVERAEAVTDPKKGSAPWEKSEAQQEAEDADDTKKSSSKKK